MIQLSAIINSRLFKLIFGLFSILYSISFVTWSLWGDSYYYYLLFPDFDSYPMMSLTLFIGNLFVKYISQDLLWLNFLSWVLCFSSIALIYFACVRKENIYRYLNYFFSGLIVLGYGTYTLYSPDTLTVFFLSLTAVYICKKTEIHFQAILTVSVFSAALIAARFPNLLILPVMVGYIVWKDVLYKMRSSMVICHASSYFVMTMFFYIIIQCLLLGTIDIYTAFVEEFSHPVSSYNTHTFSNLMSVYRGDLYVTLKDLSWFVGAICIPYLCGLITNRPKFLQLVALLPLVYLLYKEQDKLLGSMYGWKNLYAFLVILLIVIFMIKEKKVNYTLDSLLLLSFGFIMAAGSDTGFMKIGVFFSVITPIVVVEFDRLIKFNFFSGTIFTIVLCYSLYYYGMQFAGNYPFAFIRYPRATQLVSMEQKQWLTSVLSDAEQYGVKDHCVFTGISGFQVQTIMGSKMLYKCSFWQKKDDEIEIDNIMKVMKSDSLCTVFDYKNSKLLRNKMESIGIKSVCQSETYAIYKYSH